MSLYISVVNHNHDEMICKNPTLKNLAKIHHVVIKSNTVASVELNSYCAEAGIHLIQGVEKKGFGANNNEVFELCTDQLNMTDSDYFLVLNPDVEVTCETIDQLYEAVINSRTKVATINLFRNREMTLYDNSIRRFPSVLNPIKTLLKIKRNDHYNKKTITQPTTVDWAAGSFLLFSTQVYKKLKGFDERYFMYFEDVDICKRALNLLDYKVTYYPEYKATHFAQHANRSIFSKTFLHYLKSYIRYFKT
ncbi:glycosyltransferase family 2 protein [Vibrio sp. TBV020]|uniref:glycosyltransferase family 2 protein n=1 Tax=Vibrio sp. TBV020 TaxID=3137398 RepID=UPI0038CD175F